MTWRRHTSPSSVGRSVIAPVSVGRTIVRQSSSNYRTNCMKKNPYVGFIRHSPSTTTSATKKILISTSGSWRHQASWCSTAPLSLADCKNSPHIGWFRHAPPSRLDLSSTNNTSSSSMENCPFSAEEKELLWKIIQDMDPAALGGGTKLLNKDALRQHRLCVYGSLRGGGKSRRHRQKNNPFVTDFKESSAEGTMSTVDTLSRLASWFLFPVAHDAESCGYHPSAFPKQQKHQKKNKNNKKEDTLLNHLSPYLPSFLEEPQPPISNSQFSQYGARIDGKGGPSDGDDADDDSSLASDSGSEASSTAVPPVTSMSNLRCSTSGRDLTHSVSSLAEAYYAHQSATKDMDASSGSLLAPVHPPSMASSSLAVNPEHRLDYVITQMDIARMTRNASRHLDVQSILSLPVITYKKGININNKARWTVPQRPSQASGDQATGWSWTIVEESAVDFQHSNAASQSIKEQDAEFCVICLEHFEDGDRLRLLPCDHSFHVGCIDRWLSGSQSFDDCYTSGCPTCKKRPTTTKPRSQSLSEPTSHNMRTGKNRSSSLDGSVPSWAFAQIGSALVAQQEEDQGATICSGESFSA